MKRFLLTAALVAGTSPAFAQSGGEDDMVVFSMQRSMLATTVQNGIQGIEGMDGMQVNVDDLSSEQLTRLFLIINGGDSESEKANQIRGVLN